MKNGSKSEDRFCVKCGTCNTVCPVYLATGNEIHTPRGKQHLRSRIEKGDVTSHYAEIFSQCLLCGACLEACPLGLDTPELVTQVRAELPRLSGQTFLKYISRKALVHPSLLSGLSRIGAAAETLIGERLPADSGLRMRLQGFNQKAFRIPAKGYIAQLRSNLADSGKEEARETGQSVGYFAGCLANHMQPEIAEATQFLVAKATGLDANVPVGQTCCGMAALAAGKVDEARELAKRNITAFEEKELPILTSCSSCYYQLQSYAKLFADDPYWRERAYRFAERLQEFATFFLERFSPRVDTLFSGGEVYSNKVFYHDPCHLRFKLHITAEPRQLIRLLPGIELQELPNGPKCCGQGGLFQVAHPDLAQQVNDRLMDDFAKLSVKTVLTACSGCLLQWQRCLSGKGKVGQAEHLAVFMAKVLH